MLALLCCAALLAAPLPRAHTGVVIEPAALSAIETMETAYRELPELSQEIRTASGRLGTPIPTEAAAADSGDADPDGQVMTVVFRRPNLTRTSLESGPKASRVLESLAVCDGAVYWTWHPADRRYTRERAPKSMSDMPKLKTLDLVSLPLGLVMGARPFDDLRQSAQTIIIDPAPGPAGTVTVLIRRKAVEATTEMRLAIGKADHLLHTVTVDTLPLSVEGVPGRVGDALDELIPAGPAKALALPATRVEMTFTTLPERRVPADPFRFTPPMGALLFSDQPPVPSRHGYRDYIRALARDAARRSDAHPRRLKL